jgi:hypothetical protein
LKAKEHPGIPLCLYCLYYRCAIVAVIDNACSMVVLLENAC